jgi:hypothetical protein
MSNERNQGGAGDAMRFDRLVDGELAGAEYREALAELDEEPDAWRRCALAFLEAQAIRNELKRVRSEADGANPAQQRLTSPPERARSGHWPGLVTSLTVAASLMLAFILGIATPNLFPGMMQDSAGVGNDRELAATDKPNNASDGEIRHQTLRPIGNVRLVMDGGADGPRSGQVPVYEAQPGVNPLSNARPTLGPELIEWLEHSGYTVLHEQQYFPATLDDGRQLIVPVDGYQITPVGRKY